MQIYDSVAQAMLRATGAITSELAHVRTDSLDEIVPPPDEGRHAKLYRRTLPDRRTSWYLRTRASAEAPRHSRDPDPVYPVGRTRLLAVKVRGNPGQFVWWRAGNSYPSVTSSIGDHDNTRQRLVHLS